eukprot:g22238.t1
MRQRNYTTYMHSKNKKLEKLDITTSNNQVSLVPQLKVVPPQGKSIINLSDHTLQLDEIEVLSRGLNFCPTTKMDPIADKGGAIILQNRTDYCKEVYQQLNNQEHFRQLPADLTKEHTSQLNRLAKTFDPDLQSQHTWTSHRI